MWLRVVAALLLAFVLFRVFRLAMRMRYAKLERERERAEQEKGGRRVVSELPQDDGIVLFLEDPDGFSWGASRVTRSRLEGARLLLNGGVVAEVVRAGARLPSRVPTMAEFDGSERWEVELFEDAGAQRVACGRLREGVSRDAAAQVFEAVRRALQSQG